MRIVLADDEALLREGLARLLVEADFEVAGTAQDANGLLRLVEARRPELVITDIKMPPSHTDEGLVAAQEIRRRFPEVGVLVLSHYLESRYAMSLVEELPERSGYLLKDRVSEIGSLADALRRIGEGECVIDPTIVSRLVSRLRREDPLSALTERQRAVLALLAEGFRIRPSPTSCSSPSGRSRPTPNRSSGSWDSRQIPPPTDGYSPCWPSSARQSAEATS